MLVFSNSTVLEILKYIKRVLLKGRFLKNSFKGKRVSPAGIGMVNIYHFDGLKFPANYRNLQLNKWYNGQILVIIGKIANELMLGVSY